MTVLKHFIKIIVPLMFSSILYKLSKCDVEICIGNFTICVLVSYIIDLVKENKELKNQLRIK